MKNNEHKLVKDLLPSYIDKLTSDETNKFIEEHIEACENCKEYLNDMRTKILEENHTDLNSKKIKVAKKVSIRLKFLRLIILIIIAFIIINFCRKVIILKRLHNLRKSIQRL